MSVYKPGDEVLVKAKILTISDDQGDVELFFGAERLYGYCAPSEIIGLASEFGTKQEQGWIEIKPGCDMPEFTQGILITENGTTKATGFDGSFRKTITAWMPYPTPYTAPTPDCDKCQHRAVCKYMHKQMLIERNKHCGGAHYKPQGD